MHILKRYNTVTDQIVQNILELSKSLILMMYLNFNKNDGINIFLENRNIYSINKTKFKNTYNLLIINIFL